MHEIRLTPKTEIDARIRHLQAQLAEEGVDAALIIHHTNMFYYSGTSQSGHLLIPRQGEPLLMVRRSFGRARAESPLAQILDVQSLKLLPALLAEYGCASERVGLELDLLPVNLYHRYLGLFPNTEFVDISMLTRRQRMIKSPYEIELLEASAAVLDAVFAEVPAWLHAGMPELELASRFEAGMRQRGFGGGARMRSFNQDFFMGNVHAGKSAAVPSFFDGPVGGPGTSPAGNPQGAGWGCLQRNEPVYIDYASCIDGYIADETRMFCVGRMPEDMRAAYEAALAVEAAVLARARPGVLWEELYQCALEVVADAGLADFFMGPGPDRVRFVGHGVGLELDELPVLAPKLRQPLEAGMVFALEPTFVFPGGAVGIENTHLVEATGIRTLTRAPREIVCVS